MALTGALKKTDRHTGPGQLQGHLNLRFLTGDTRVALGDQENEVMDAACGPRLKVKMVVCN